jgi:hypothetical protein
MTKDDLSQILRSEWIRATTSPLVIELRPKGILSGLADSETKFERLIAAFLDTSQKLFYCPHEPDEAGRPGARYRRWPKVEANTWMIPRGIPADEVMHDPAYPHGWTIYSGSATLSESDWQRRSSDMVALLDELVRTQRVVAILVSDPDGTPWLIGLDDTPGAGK